MSLLTQEQTQEQKYKEQKPVVMQFDISHKKSSKVQLSETTHIKSSAWVFIFPKASDWGSHSEDVLQGKVLIMSPYEKKGFYQPSQKEIRDTLQYFERKFDMTSEEFLCKWNEGTPPEDPDVIEWAFILEKLEIYP